MTTIEKILKFLERHLTKDETYITVQKKDDCFCGSGKKYKKCHLSSVEAKNKIAYVVIDKTGKKRIKYLKKKSNRIKSTLTWEQIGGGSIGKVDQ